MRQICYDRQKAQGLGKEGGGREEGSVGKQRKEEIRSLLRKGAATANSNG